MFGLVKKWNTRYFSHPETLILLFTVVVCALILFFLGRWIVPILAGLVIAFLLDNLIKLCTNYLKVPRMIAMPVVYLVFLAILILFVFGLLPYLGQQLANLVSEVPLALKHFHAYLHTLPTLYPALFSHSSVHDMIGATTIGAGKFSAVGKVIFSASVSTIPNLITWLVYLFLVPLLVWFFLKDKFKVMAWFNQFIPLQRGLIDRVAREMKVQLGNYVRGKVIEGLIVSIVTYIGFICFGLEYAFLLAFAVGVSVIIPYVGMVLVTIPVVIIGLMQWGPSAHFAYMLAVYFVIQALDGNLLVPVLFSEKVNLHPIAIIAAVLIFGGIWGFWGLFFAIPLATLVRAIVMAWMESVV